MVTDLVSKYNSLSFAAALRTRANHQRSWLCIGLDPVPERLPANIPRSVQGMILFCRDIVEATSPYAAAFKINFAFFEALGSEGWRALEKVRMAIPDEIPVIADAKRGDIDHSARNYASAILDDLAFGGVTVNPYLGWDSVAPFASYPRRCVFVLCKTSNPGAADVQDLQVSGGPLYMHIARLALQNRAPADIGLVVGATQPEALTAVRALSPDLLILCPGVGAQGARADTAIRWGANARGKNLLAAASRSVLYASSGSNYMEAAAEAARLLAAQTWQRDNVRRTTN